MSAPAISVILPVYNSIRYLAQAIDSILAQTFTNFELVIVDDGSDDGSLNLAESYTDARIKVFSNGGNQGLIYTLNRAIGLSKGNYIARMDADDISMPERLAKQKQWLDDHAGTALVACTIQFIDEEGSTQGTWKEDTAATSYKSIKAKMPKENCIAHPTVMLRREVALRYPYSFKQLHSEDYDLWLRMLAAGLVLEKLPQSLLLYRVHQTSVTGSVLRKTNPFYKQLHCKKNFLLSRLGRARWGLFETRVLMGMLYDGLMGTAKKIKPRLKK